MRFVSCCRTGACVAIVPQLATAVAAASVLAATLGGALPAAANDGMAPLRLLAGTAGTPSDTTLDMVHELSIVLASRRGPRLIAMLGSGGTSDAADLAALADIDVAILPTSALTEPAAGATASASLAGRIGIVAKLHDAELHILGAPGIGSLSDLAGKTVNMGPAGSGSATIAGDVFQRLGVTTSAIHVSLESGLAKLAAGEIAATVLLTGKPARALAQRSLPSGVRLLDIPFAPEFDAAYLPAAFQAHDYPGLVADGSSVSTIAVGVVIAARMPEATAASTADAARTARIETFVGALSSALATLQVGHHPKWRDSNLVATVTGSPRHPAAQRWLASQGAADALQSTSVTAAPNAMAKAQASAAAPPAAVPAVPTTTANPTAAAVPQQAAKAGAISQWRASAAVDPMLAFAEAARAAGGNAAEQERLFKIFLEQSKSRPPGETAVSAALP